MARAARSLFLCFRKRSWISVPAALVNRVSSTKAVNSKPQQKQTAADFSWIGCTSPCYGMNGDQVTVLEGPKEFYDTLKKKAALSKNRIVIASLYLGTGSLEQDLVTAIDEACANAQKENQHLTVDILLDCTRGSRGLHNSRTMVLPLLKKYPKNINFYLFHTPKLRGVVKRLLPDRFNEVVGVCHLKVYLFDNTVVMSGANLSDSYFTNRQDRYIVYNDVVHLADFLHRLVSVMSTLSFKVTDGNKLHLWHHDCVHPYKGRYHSYRSNAKQKLEDLIQSEIVSDHCRSMLELSKQKHDNTIERGSELNAKIDTWVYPTLQMAPLGLDQDNIITQQIWTRAPPGGCFYLASGYFNLTKQYMYTIIQRSRSNFKILGASPQANGFFGAAGVSAYVPLFYTFVAKTFHKQVLAHRQQLRISLHEFYKDKWTFHSKGLWYYPPCANLPIMTLIGSPNFGYRSVYRDIEAQLVMVTENRNLQEKLHQEQENLYSRAKEVNKSTFKEQSRFVPLWASAVSRCIRSFF